MVKSILFLPIAVVGAAVLVLGPPVLGVLLLAIGLIGTVASGALGARDDDELRRDATGTGPTEGNLPPR